MGSAANAVETWPPAKAELKRPERAAWAVPPNVTIVEMVKTRVPSPPGSGVPVGVAVGPEGCVAVAGAGVAVGGTAGVAVGAAAVFVGGGAVFVGTGSPPRLLLSSPHPVTNASTAVSKRTPNKRSFILPPFRSSDG